MGWQEKMLVSLTRQQEASEVEPNEEEEEGHSRGLWGSVMILINVY